MTIPVSHLPGCYKTSRADPSRYACNCGADSQNELRAMLDRVEAAVHSHRVDDGSLETAATTERTFPRVSLSTVVPGSLVEIASGDIGIAIRFDGGNLRPIAWITTGHVGTMPASATVSLRATPTELDALTSADGASRPGLTEEQAEDWAEDIWQEVDGEPCDDPAGIVASALLRASRGETGPTKPGAQ